MTNYGIQTQLKYILPYYFGFKATHDLSKKASERLKWMDYIDLGNSIGKCARHFDHPYRTVKFWKDKYNRYDLRSLENCSRRPKHVRKPQITQEKIWMIIETRKYELPGSGKVIIQAYIKKTHNVVIGQSAIQRVINESGLKRVKRKRTGHIRTNRKHMYTVPKDIMKKPGGLVYIDVKHIRIKREKWYQFTALDHATRMLKTKIYKQINSNSTVEFLDYVSKSYPFLHIKYIGTDNGSEFMGEFDKRLKEQEIKHVFSSPASPKQNPYVERVIRTIIEQQYEIYGIEDTPKLQQQALEDFCVRYNEKRPHQSLNFLTPQEMYVKLSKQ